MRRLSLRPESSRSDNPSSTLGLGVGAILAMGGLLLATQGLPDDGNPAAMEAEGGRGGRHGGDDYHTSLASRTARRATTSTEPNATGSAAAPDSEQHSPEETDENSTISPPPAAPAAPPDPEPDSGGGGGGSGGGAPPNGDGGGGEAEEFPAEGSYRFYILTPEEAAAEGTSALDGFAGGWDGYEDDEDDDEDDDRGGRRLKERYHFVVIGGGTTADAAMESILRMRPEAEILCLSDETPCPADDSDTHTGSYEADFRLLKTDLVASFNQWRRHLAFRKEGFANGGGGGGGGGTTTGDSRGADGGEGRWAYGLSKGKEIRYHTYEPHDLIIEPERRCVRLLLDGTEVYYDKCLIANAGKPRDFALGGGGGGGGGGDDGDGTSEEEHAPRGSGRRLRRRERAKKAGDNGGRRGRSDKPLGIPEREAVGGGGSGSGGGSWRSRINKLTCLRDFVSLELLANDPSVKHVSVLGGGFLGCQVALALAERGRATGVAISQVYSERNPMGHVLPDYLAEHLRGELAKAGVAAVADTRLADLRYNSKTKRLEEQEREGAKHVVGGDDGKVGLETDYVVVASTDVDPGVEVASDSGLEIDERNGGIVVNGLFEAVNGVYAAGGAASFFDPNLGRGKGRRRIASHDHCVNSGLYAGYNMAATLTAAENDHEPAGSSTPSASPSASPRRKGPPPAPHPRFYDHVPFWRSNLAACGVVMEGLGDVDPSLRTMGVWLDYGEDNRKASYRRGVVYYMRDDKGRKVPRNMALQFTIYGTELGAILKTHRVLYLLA
ncbi:conserved unknown protein [Ectocarpus siliculosus]|uniref:FAD/NAD(P)-binding domain-containing protein n=1 Tax=Ectocarpus siliculosus TaxID=2880 RepID=D7G9D2_ECTSI|nr:conserved unknown protein [Ectocarpus siliculosus]|eukprot:CBJ28272.1 conserved unknown protein [Ectocarpus siliculosus]